MIKSKIRRAGIESSKAEDKQFLESNHDQTNLSYHSKWFENYSDGTLINYLHLHIENQDRPPLDINQLFEQYFRVIDLTTKACNCSNFFQSASCKCVFR